MSLESIVSWVLCGLIVGLCARLLVPGRQDMSLLMMVLLGIAGALVGGFIFSVVRGPSAAPFSLTDQNWYGWIVAILGAVLLVWLYPLVYPRRWWN